MVGSRYWGQYYLFLLRKGIVIKCVPFWDYGLRMLRWKLIYTYLLLLYRYDEFEQTFFIVVSVSDIPNF